MKKIKKSNSIFGEWIWFKDSLPKMIKEKDGYVNFVLVWFEPNPECGSHYQVVDTKFAHNNAKFDGKIVDNPMYVLGDKTSPKKFRHKVWFTHWMYLPRDPKNSKKWIFTKDEAPKIIEAKDGSVNSILAWTNFPQEHMSNYFVANTVWVNKQIKSYKEITHWMYLPEPPKGKREINKNKGVKHVVW